FATAGAADRFHFAGAEAGEVVVQHEVLAALAGGEVDRLLVHGTAEGYHVDRLGLAAGEDGAAVGAGQYVHFAPDRADLIGPAAVQSLLVIEHHTADRLFLHFLEIAGEHRFIG